MPFREDDLEDTMAHLMETMRNAQTAHPVMRPELHRMPHPDDNHPAGEATARELLRTSDLTDVPKFERFRIDDKTEIDVPIAAITPDNTSDGDQIHIEVDGSHSRITQLIILRKKKLK